MTNIDRVLAFAFSHQLVIIELIFAVIMAIAAVWLFNSIRGDSGETKENLGLNEVEQALKRVLQSTDFKTSSAQAAQLIKDDDDDPMAPLSKSTGGQGLTPDPAELARLRSEMDAKNKKFSEVETALAQAKAELAKVQAAQAANAGGSAGGSAGAAATGASGISGASGAEAGGTAINTDELQAKIKSLESRLAEYEIIEDDIANLSLYKEENVKLRGELDKIKKGGAWDSSVSPAPNPASAPQAPAAPAPGPAPIDSDKLVKEFDALVAQDKGTPKTSEKPADPLVAEKPPEKGAEAAAAGDGGEKLIEEFENFVKGTNS